MCGIAGILLRNAAVGVDIEGFLQFAAQQHKSRGPDGVGYFRDGNFFAVHNRLSILGGEAGAQPVVDEHLVMLFNGEIYNAQQLTIANASSRSDTAQLFSSVVESGPMYGDIFPKLVGMYAVAIYDREALKLTLARDRYGEKPLYYLISEKYIAFSSTVDPLAWLLDEVEVDELNTSFFLATRTTPPAGTHLRGIRSVEAGEVLQLRADSGIAAGLPPSIPARELRVRKASEAIGLANSGGMTFEKRLEGAVSDCLIADTPVALCLSGGLDSTAIASVVRKLNSDVSFYTVNFTDGPSTEYERVKHIERKLGLPTIRTIDVSTADLVAIAESAFSASDVLNADPTALPFSLMMARISSDGIPVALTGEGADEIFLGYRIYRYLGIYNLLPKALAVMFGRGIGSEGAAGYVCRTFRRDILPLFQDPDRVAGWISKCVSNISEIDRDRSLRLAGDLLMRGDRVGMRYSVEVRSPYLHPVLLPDEHIGPVRLMNVGKKAIRSYVARNLGSDFASLPKIGFDIDLRAVAARALVGKLEEWRDRRYYAEFLRPGVIDRLLQKSGQRALSSRDADLLIRLFSVGSVINRARSISVSRGSVH